MSFFRIYMMIRKGNKKSKLPRLLKRWKVLPGYPFILPTTTQCSCQRRSNLSLHCCFPQQTIRAHGFFLGFWTNGASRMCGQVVLHITNTTHYSVFKKNVGQQNDTTCLLFIFTHYSLLDKLIIYTDRAGSGVVHSLWDLVATSSWVCFGRFLFYFALLWWLLYPVWHCNHLIWEEGVDCFVFCWFIICDVCPCWFTLPLGRLCSVIVALCGYLHYCY